MTESTANHAKQKGIAVDIDLPAHMERLPAPVAAALYRMAQDFLAGIFRVPGNSRAKLRIAVQDRRVVLQAGVEGQSISQEVLEEAARGVGKLGVTIAGMHARIAQLGGHLGNQPLLKSEWVAG